MFASLGTWLSKLDPNVAVPIVVSLLAYLYHALLSPAAQAKVASAVNDAMELAQKAIDAALALAPAGTTAAQLEGDLLNVAKAQLAHAGFDPSKLPPIVLSLVQALVNVALAQWQATQPVPVTASASVSVSVPVSVPSLPAQPQAVPIVAIPPVTPPGSAKGMIRPHLAIAIAGALAMTGVALEYGCGGAQKPGSFGACAQVALQQTITVDSVVTTVGDAVDNALATGTAGIPAALLQIVAQLGVPLGLDLITCALDLLEGKPALPIDAGVTVAGSVTAPTVSKVVETQAQRIAAARQWVTQMRQAYAAKPPAQPAAK